MVDASTAESQVLKRLDFPAYCIRMLENGLVALAGGGGTAKTGVANALELGLVDYDLTDYSSPPAAARSAATSPSASPKLPHTPILERLLSANGRSRQSPTAPPRAFFETVHAYQPHDAIMKFISFSFDRPCSACKNNKTTSSTADSNHSSTTTTTNRRADKATEAAASGVQRNVYLIAAMNNWLEFYEVQSAVQRSNESGELGHGGGGDDAAKLRQRKSSAAKKKSSSSTSSSTSKIIDNNNNKGHSNGKLLSSADDDSSRTTLKAGSQLNLVFKIDIVSNKSIDLINKPDNETFLPETAPSEATETVNTMAISKAAVAASSGTKDARTSSILLCVGTSKGSIMIWNVGFKYDDRGRLQSISQQRCHANTSAHNNKEIDDVQVNESLVDPSANISHLLSIGRDNKCCIWSLCSKDFAKLAEFDYLASLGAGNSNLRMRHARYDALGRNFYATYIPKSRGGGGDTSSFVQRWAALKYKKPAGYQPGKDAAKDLVEFELNGTVFNYKLMATRRVRNTIITAMQCSRDGSQVCLGDYEGRVYLYDMDLNVLRHFKRQHTSVVTDLAFYYDSVRPYEASKLILSLSIDRTLQCYKNLANVQSAKSQANQAALLKTESFLDAKKASGKALAAAGGKKGAGLGLIGALVPKLFCFLALVFLIFSYFFGHFE